MAPDRISRPLLRGWKDIASYMGVSVRTAQRLADADGLPVHHTGHQKGGATAYPAELDAWVTRRDASVPVGSSADHQPTDATEVGDAASLPEPFSERQSDEGVKARVQPIVEVTAKTSPSSARHLVIAIGALSFLGVVATAFMVLRPERSTGNTADVGAVSVQTPSRDGTGEMLHPPRTFRIRAQIGERSPADLRIAEGRQGSVQIGTMPTLYLEPLLQGQLLHVILYELTTKEGEGGTLDMVGEVDLKAPEGTTYAPIRLLFDHVWLELTWVQ